ncbi:MAG TPA: hypothetical protein VFX70_13275 [Mycobacteriales bacterium]|nr:hypothetical protein [Mycobacteriales bacterium]
MALRASFWDSAADSWVAGTVRRIATIRAGMKNARPAPMTTATTTIWASVSRSAASATGIDPAATSRIASVVTSTARLFHRSTRAPAGRPASTAARVSANATRPAQAGEPVTASTSSG